MKSTRTLVAFAVASVLTAGPAIAVQESGALECADRSIAVLGPPPGAPEEPPADSTYSPMRGFSDADLGVGHLVLAVDTLPKWWLWHHAVWLPLAEQPGEMPWAWLANGWLVETGKPEADPLPIDASGMVETGYEIPSFVVLEERSDGWLRFRYATATDARDGTAWAHPCQLAGGRLPVQYVRWADWFMRDGWPLYFRTDVRHALRSEPAIESEHILWIPVAKHEYLLEPLEIRGDWMRVRVKQPSDHCWDPPEVRVDEGWVRWRGPERGPWVWYHSRGC